MSNSSFCEESSKNKWITDEKLRLCSQAYWDEADEWIGTGNTDWFSPRAPKPELELSLVQEWYREYVHPQLQNSAPVFTVRALTQAVEDFASSKVDTEDELPSFSASTRAKRTLRRLQASFGMSTEIDIPTVSAFDGSIRIVWDYYPRILKLVFPSSDHNKVYIYYQDAGVAPCIEDNPTDERIIERMSWVTAFKAV